MFLRKLVTALSLVASFDVFSNQDIPIAADQGLYKTFARSIRTPFSKEDDAKLLNLVASYGKEKIDWKKIAIQMKKTVRQCRERWKNYVDPSLNHSPWTEDEYAKLKQLYTERGGQWNKFVAYFNGRSAVDIKNHCRIFWRKGEIEKQPNNRTFTSHWIEGEDQKLREAVEMYPRDWIRISQYVGGGRSQQACESRWNHYIEEMNGWIEIGNTLPKDIFQIDMLHALER